MPNHHSTTTNDSSSPASQTQIKQREQSNSVHPKLLESGDIHSRLLLIDQAVKEYLETLKGEPKILYEAAQHLILAGGKRLRSLITLVSCEAVGGSIEKVLPITVAAELLQTASLIHDDIIDKDELRRGVPTVHKKYGYDVAILAGDFLIAQVFRIIGEHGSPELVANVGAGGARMCEGEVADLFINPEDPVSFTKKTYLKMIERKTVAFLEEAAKIGAIVGGATEPQELALTRYGLNIGYAFQLRDDILDIEASEQTIRKSSLSDLRLKRGNYPFIHAFEVSTNKNREECLRALNNNDWNRVIKLIKQTDAVTHTILVAEGYVKKAKHAIEGQNFQNQDLLEKLADFALHRES